MVVDSGLRVMYRKGMSAQQAIEDMITHARNGVQKYGSSGKGHFYSQRLIGGTIVDTYDYPDQAVRIELPYITGTKGLSVAEAVQLIDAL